MLFFYTFEMFDPCIQQSTSASLQDRWSQQRQQELQTREALLIHFTESLSHWFWLMTKQSLYYTMASQLFKCVNKILLHFCAMRRVSEWAFGFGWGSLAFKSVAVSISFTLTKTQTGTPHHCQECRICVHAVPTGKKSTVEGWSPFAKPFIEDLRFNMHLGSC